MQIHRHIPWTLPVPELLQPQEGCPLFARLASRWEGASVLAASEGALRLQAAVRAVDASASDFLKQVLRFRLLSASPISPGSIATAGDDRGPHTVAEAEQVLTDQICVQLRRPQPGPLSSEPHDRLEVALFPYVRADAYEQLRGLLDQAVARVASQLNSEEYAVLRFLRPTLPALHGERGAAPPSRVLLNHVIRKVWIEVVAQVDALKPAPRKPPRAAEPRRPTGAPGDESWLVRELKHLAQPDELESLRAVLPTLLPPLRPQLTPLEADLLETRLVAVNPDTLEEIGQRHGVDRTAMKAHSVTFAKRVLNLWRAS